MSMKLTGDKIGEAFWWVFIVFMLPSVIHIAVVFHVWDDSAPAPAALDPAWIGYIFWWVVALVGSAAIDGAIVYLSRAVEKEFGQSNKSHGFIAFDLFCVTALTAFSWLMNFWYAQMNSGAAHATLGNAWSSKVLGTLDSSTVMPYVVSALPVLALMYTMIAAQLKKIQERSEVQPMTEAEHQAELQRIKWEKELRDAKKGVSLTERIQQGQQALETLNKSDQKREARVSAIVDWLNKAPEMIDPAKEKEAIKALALYLKIKEKEVLAYLIPARAIASKENEKQNDIVEENTPVLWEQPLEDKLQKTIDFLGANGMDITDEELAKHLNLLRPASARFWRLKAMEIIRVNPLILEKKEDRTTGPLSKETVEENEGKTGDNIQGNTDVSQGETGEISTLDKTDIQLITVYPNAMRLLSTSDTTVHLEKVANAFDCTMKLLRNRVADGKIRRTRNPDIVYIDSVIEWAKQELFSKGKGKVISLENARNSQEKSEENQEEKVIGE